MVTVPDPTRAEIARQRLAELAAQFDASLPDPDRPDPGRRRKPRLAHVGIRPAHLRFVTVAAAAALVLVVWWLLAGRPAEVAVPMTTTVTGEGAAAPPAQASDGSAELVIDVAGRVKRPGIVTLPAGSRVHEAIAAAGGLKGRTDTSSLNLARVLTDGEQVLVGATPTSTAPGAGGSTSAVNLNTADLVALDALPGVGPVTAESIVAWREENGPFRSVEDLLDVSGIGEATLADLRDHVTV